MQRALIVGALCLVLPALSWARQNTGWWGFGGEVLPTQWRCHLLSEDEGPLAYMRLVEINGWAYRMEDVEENGQLVETTMIAPNYTLTHGRLTWYGTRGRCEQALRKAQQERAAAQRQRERLQERYR